MVSAIGDVWKEYREMLEDFDILYIPYMYNHASEVFIDGLDKRTIIFSDYKALEDYRKEIFSEEHERYDNFMNNWLKERNHYNNDGRRTKLKDDEKVKSKEVADVDNSGDVMEGYPEEKPPLKRIIWLYGKYRKLGIERNYDMSTMKSMAECMLNVIDDYDTRNLADIASSGFNTESELVPFLEAMSEKYYKMNGFWNSPFEPNPDYMKELHDIMNMIDVHFMGNGEPGNKTPEPSVEIDPDIMSNMIGLYDEYKSVIKEKCAASDPEWLRLIAHLASKEIEYDDIHLSQMIKPKRLDEFEFGPFVSELTNTIRQRKILDKVVENPDVETMSHPCLSEFYEMTKKFAGV